ncbi:MAG TPA: bifunctional precorrin-2 dehydrogenase/sirohydrochlorin ferrochelatase [Syntrophomonadaceae bacterium]|nr:bifunctional precorrin-2 dehydrogenase/sirohydrochlorin ferrochelatase [Syntrophomonadaceae bacterium]
MKSNKHFYPIYINLMDKPCLIVGGGTVAQRKVESLLDYGARVTVVSPVVTDSLSSFATEGLITIKPRKFVPDDLEVVFMVFIATNDNETNRFIAKLCADKQILVNAVDDPPNCDFYVPSIVRRGSLALAISTEGKSPMLAKLLREELEGYLVEEYAEYVDLLGEYRGSIKEEFSDINIRKQIFHDLVHADIFDILKDGKRERARERIEECISLWRD